MWWWRQRDNGKVYLPPTVVHVYVCKFVALTFILMFRQQSSTAVAVDAETDSLRAMKIPTLRSLVTQMESSSSMQAIHRPEVSASKSQTSVDINSPHVSVVGVMYYFI